MARKLRIECPGAIYHVINRGEGGRMGEHHYGLERAESAQERAARIAAEKLARAGWTEAELRQRPKAMP